MQILSLIIYYIFTVGGYLFFSRQPTDNHFLTIWDKYVPTIPVFVVPYLFATSLFLLIPIFFYYKLDFLKTKVYLLIQVIASLMSYVVFSLYPTSIIREPIIEKGTFAEILKFIHLNDRPSAAFPSGHVFQSIIIAYFLWHYFPKTRIYILIVLPLIIISTIFLKQHYLPDILGGVIVAFVSILIGRRFYRRE